MPLEIYLDPCTINSRKVLAGLDLIGIDYDYHYINYFEGGQKDPDFVKNINPSATVPAAKDGDLRLTESNAILQYAADLKGNSTAYPTDLKQRASVNRWLLWEASAWFPSCYIYLIQNVVQPLMGGKPDQSVLSAEEPKWKKQAKILNDQLGQTKFLVGNDVTIADIAVKSCIHLPDEAKLPLEDFPHLRRWIGEIQALPCWIKTQGAVEKALCPHKVSKTNGATNGASNGLPQEVEAEFNYSKDLADKLTELYFYDSPKAASIHEPGDAPGKCTVHNGWARKDDFHVDKHGFSVENFSTSYTGKWEDDPSVREKFYPDVVEFVKKTLGAKEVLVFDHTIRTKANAQKKLTDQSNTSQRAPVRLVHCDYTAESGPVRVKQLLPDRADDLLSRRVAFINVWKPLKKVEENPLAMIDATTAPFSDFFKLYLRYQDRTGENYVMRHSPDHKWYYFPDMDESQVILLKTFDSDSSRARFVGHSAFDDPTSKPDAPFRESVEIRTIAFF